MSFDFEYSADHLARLLATSGNVLLPTSQQRQVIEANLDPRLVIAGAGSGKTATMAQRVVFLVANRLVEPSQILGLTFTRKAAGELAERIRYSLRLLSHSIPDLPTFEFPKIATYNSFAAQLVSDHALRIGENPESILISEAALVQLAEEVITTWPGTLESQKAVSTLVEAVLGLSGELAEHGRTTAELQEYLDSLLVELHTKAPGKRVKGPKVEARKLIASLLERQELSHLVAAFQQEKAARGVVDFGDQVRIAARLANQVSQVSELLRQQYPVVLLDEYQDTSIAQVELLAGLFGGGHSVCAVGDPNQAIYGWRGAAAGTLLDFPQTFTQSDGSSAHVSHLNVAWRNAPAILTVANHLAAPLQSDQVQPLQSAPSAQGGHVDLIFTQTYLEEAEQIADYVATHWHGGAEQEQTAAVLCRGRKQFAAIAHALQERGIPVQISGLAGLLNLPEVNDVWRMLQVIADPARGDALMRLLVGPYVRLGAVDLRHLWQWARTIDPQEPALADAISQLPSPDWRDRHGYQLSETARIRLTQLAQMIANIRELTYLDLPDLIVATYRAMGLDVELMARSRYPDRALENLREFTQAASNYSAATTMPSLTGFLAWVAAAQEHERGLAIPQTDVRSDCVQILTIHAAKGLEWDVVVVAGCNDGDFPSIKVAEKEPKASGWLTDMGLLPYGLRGDYKNLPSLNSAAADTFDDLDDAITEFMFQEGARALLEERRLAYVAFTRPRSRLLITGSYWGMRKSANSPSVFMRDAASALGQGDDWLPPRQADENPVLQDAVEGTWPTVSPAQPQDAAPLPAQVDQQFLTEVVDLLIAERNRQQAPPPPPVHLPASSIVKLAQDSQDFLRRRLRPIPSQPSYAARRGTQFHAWVEQHFGSQSLLDWQELPGWAETEDAAYPQELIDAFKSSPWVNQDPVAVEADIETELGGLIIRCRIDAVFRDDEAGADHYCVVDWKTGRPPTDEAARAALGQQLLLYRIAWSRHQNVPLDHVSAAFHYVGSNQTIPGGEGTEADIDELVRANFPAVD